MIGDRPGLSNDRRQENPSCNGSLAHPPPATGTRAGSISTSTAIRSPPPSRVDRPPAPEPTHPADGKDIPVRHVGAILEWQEWQCLADRLREQGVGFLIEPGIRFQWQVGEQATLFIRDPAGNGLEFKAFKDPARVSAR